MELIFEVWGEHIEGRVYSTSHNGQKSKTKSNSSANILTAHGKCIGNPQARSTALSSCKNQEWEIRD